MSQPSMNPSVPRPMAETPRVIGPVAAFAVVAGSMLGVGIFLFPGRIAFEVDAAPAFFLLWLLGGLFALAGAVACGELGAMLPRAGGDYVFQREAFGPSMAFASGWVLFAAIFAGSIASMSVAVFQYQVASLVGRDLTLPLVEGLPVSGAQLLALGLVAALTALNDAGTRLSTRAQVVLTVAPMAVLAAVAAWVLVLAPAPLAAPVLPKPGASELTLAGLASGFVFVNFAFSGWINIIYVASEVEEPGRNVPRAMISAVFGVTGLYLLLCAAFLSVLGFAGLAALGWTDAGTGMARALGSPGLATAILLTIAVAIVTSVNATILSSARVAYAMGRDGAFWRGAATLGPNRTPRRALWLQAGLASGLVLSGTFDSIVELTSIAMFVTGTVTVLSMFALRRKRPELPRPYRATLYPWLPALYVLLSLAAIGATAWRALSAEQPSFKPLVGVAILAAAYLGHRLFARRSPAPDAPPPA